MVDDWIEDVEDLIEDFADEHSHTYSKTERQISASFEIGCFHALVSHYDGRYDIHTKNLTDDDEYNYLTTPNGNPDNFSYVEVVDNQGRKIQVRQQVRIRSESNRDIYFTPDLVVLKANTDIDANYDEDYANARRRFFSVSSDNVIAAHECKSMNPFPELIVSFLGMLFEGHTWLEEPNDFQHIVQNEGHLAPTLFVGGTSRSLHERMIKALERYYPINIILGMHYGWNLFDRDKLSFVDVYSELNEIQKTRKKFIESDARIEHLKGL